MKQILSLAVLLAIVSFIAAQGPPALTPQQCFVPQNATGTAFCSGVWNYLVKNGTDLAAANTAANNQYNQNIAKLTNPTQACQQALTAFACQSNLPRCGRYQNYANVLKSRCDTVNTACGISGFPSNFTGPACVVNSVVTVDGPAVVCFGSQYTNVGGSCNANPFDPAAVLPTPVVVNACPPVSSCNTTTSTCVRPNNLGDTCVSTCVSPAASQGSPLTCIAGTCQYTGKRHDFACVNNAECLSQNCTSGKCFESPLFGFCTGTNQCRNNLYCDTKNSTCYAAAQQGELCGFVQPNWSIVPCLAGFTCVRFDNLTAKCQPNANLGQACTNVVSANVYDAPICAPSQIPTTGFAQCINGQCVVAALRQLGDACNATANCVPTATCQYTAGATQGTCVAPGSVACDTVGGNNCNVAQKCTCGTDQSATGTCAVDTSSPTVNCALQSVAVQQCLKDKCQSPSAAFYPYDGYSCGATQCLAQVNAYFCCVKTTVGANYVPPQGQPTDPCVTPTQTPGPSTSGPTGTPTPIQSSKRSGAATVAVSFVAMIVAVIAFCL